MHKSHLDVNALLIHFLMEIYCNRSETCPQCRKPCGRNNYSRLYIDFVCDEELACAPTMKFACASDEEETIKILLEHLDTGAKCSDVECENCKVFCEAFDCAQKDNDEIRQSLNAQQHQNNALQENHDKALQRIEELEMTVRANEHNLKEIQERLETCEMLTAALEADVADKQDTIYDMKISIHASHNELDSMVKQVYDLNQQIDEMKTSHDIEINALCETFKCKGNMHVQLLRRQANRAEAEAQESNDCKALVPYSGDIASWDYIMIPILKKPTKPNPLFN